MEFNLTTIWFLLGLILVLSEFAVPGVILVFFGVGAWVVATSTYFGITGSLESQVLLFSITSIALLIFLRKWIKGKFYGHVSDEQDLTQNLNEFIGKEVLVKNDVIPGEPGGKVEFKGADWSAVSDEYIQNGKLATITERNGLTLKIKEK